MMKNIVMYIVLALVILVAGCSSPSANEAPAESTVGEATQVAEIESEPIQIAVSIVPQATVAKAIGGEYVDVVTMIPPGNSPANYAPTQKEMAQLSESRVYFSIGVPTEGVNIMPLLESGDYNLELVNLAKHVDAVYPARYFSEDHEDHDHEDHGEKEGDSHDHDGRDPHIWLSPKRIRVMAEEMAATLVRVDPGHEPVYKENLDLFLTRLSGVEKDLDEMLGDMKDASFLIYHPSLGYFADEYGLKMLALENEGKAATVQGMAGVIDFALEHHIKTVFYQAEFDSKQAELLAQEIGGQAVQVNPLSENLVDNLKEMGTLIKNSIE
jgi:zinc transport system substrate-binding protein